MLFSVVARAHADLKRTTETGGPLDVMMLTFEELMATRSRHRNTGDLPRLILDHIAATAS